MNNERVGAIRLQGTDAEHFVKSLFNPTRDELFEYEERKKRLDEKISIKRIENGFEAEIKDLDLSFLDEDIQNEKMTVTLTLSINLQKKVFYNGAEAKGDYILVFSPVHSMFNSCETNDSFNMAS